MPRKPPRTVASTGVEANAPETRMRALFDGEYDFVWRVARRLGAANAQADDVAQQVFIVASQKLERIELGKERAFLFGTAMRVVANLRRRAAGLPVSGIPPEATADVAPGPEEQLDQARRRALLDRLLDQLGLEQRSVFVLYELEGMTMAEIAEMLGVPSGTVASRLRRAREQFEQAVSRHRRVVARTGS